MSFCNFKCETSLSLFVMNKIESIIGTVDETIINIGFKKLKPIDHDNKLVFKIKKHIYIFLI